ncbi:MAG TPA: DUF2884 family protein [Rhodanobacteraceae bacterium]|jgi:hypothetical protein|nr:DUF2884 family protein [Rhodanobacteraceae bacterium]
MNKLLTLTGAALATVTLAACSPGINEGIGHRITFDSNGMVVHATGKPDAHIGKDGSLAIDDHTVEVTPAQRAMLQRYYGEARSMMQSGEAVGKQGMQIATNSISAAISSIFHDGSSPAEKKLDAQSDQIETAAARLCDDLKALDETQQTLATEIPAFAPYASSSHGDCIITRNTVRDDNIAVARSSGGATPPSRPASPTASTSSEP